MISIILFFFTPLLIKMPYTLLGLALTLLIYGFTVGAFTVASANFTAEIASSENLTRFMGFNSISFIIAKGLSPAVGIKLMDKYGFSVAVYGTVVVAVMAMALVFFLSDIQIDKKKDDDSNFFKSAAKSQCIFTHCGFILRNGHFRCYFCNAAFICRC